jgi:hypothetical protein
MDFVLRQPPPGLAAHRLDAMHRAEFARRLDGGDSLVPEGLAGPHAPRRGQQRREGEGDLARVHHPGFRLAAETAAARRAAV